MKKFLLVIMCMIGLVLANQEGKIKDYKIICSMNLNYLYQQIWEYLEDGWILYGYPFSGTHESLIITYHVCQALIKK